MSYLQHLDNEDAAVAANLIPLDQRDFNTDRFRLIGEELVSKAVLLESVRDGKCFQVSLQKEGDEDVAVTHWADVATERDSAVNWICEDDLENYWEQNCFVLHPVILTCMDELAALKHTGDVENLQLALQRGGSLEPSQFYHFDYLAQLFVG